MKRINIDIPLGRYLIAVSGGPDSMALLDIVRKKNYYIEVAHVNYHKRDSAKNDESLLRKYCRKYSIKFHLLNVYPNDIKGNFQAYARNKRYSFFNKLCIKNKLDAVLIGHHLDDHIETYLMQIKKNIGVSYYGLNKNNIVNNTKVIRPLLKYEKNDLIEYCNKNNIEYGIDESNYSDIYTRNKIRHSSVEKMSYQDKIKLVKEINLKNKHKQLETNIVNKYMNNNSYTLNKFLKLKYLNAYLRRLIPNKSERYYDEMIKQIKTSKQCVFIYDDLYLVKEYERVNIFKKPEDYEYVFNSIDDMKSKTYKYFKLRSKGNSFEGVTISKNDFPITIRNYKEKDSIKMTYGTKKINRFFIDNKINLKDRLSWPVMLNKTGSAILVPEIGCDIKHYSKKHNMFMIKL